ncbi:hypothetical protein UFOVP649_83 [uncultured Caudovirales phage]|jgi:hypothetical protein|uniref:Uncharacterized protein n=1 Tax=uncultured Caudovirales phage TaxID=2100421 RepID=A0A6J5NDS5_9CAUD|nr:hypothetical protein UFOVP649_83 [uncultured Caudovirales phage]
MKLSDLYRILTIAMNSRAAQEAEVLLHYEQSAMEDGFSKVSSEGISDVRLIDDWALPGKSLMTDEGPLPQKLVIFYDNHFKLDSSIEP